MAVQGEQMMTNNELNKSGNSGKPQQKVSNDSARALAVCICRLLILLPATWKRNTKIAKFQLAGL